MLPQKHSLEHYERVIESVGMDYEVESHSHIGNVKLKLYRRHGGLSSFGSGRNLTTALGRAMLDQPIDWRQAEERLLKAECEPIMHL